MTNIPELASTLVALTVKDVQELVQVLETDYGIKPSATVVTAGPAAGAVAEEKTAFDVMLKSAGASKLNVVKAVKDATGLGLKEAKELVDAAPKAVKEGISKAEAEALAAALKEAGAEVEIK